MNIKAVMKMSAIQTKSLSKNYKGLLAVKSLDLSINQGELFALLGLNGAAIAALMGDSIHARHIGVGNPYL